MNDTSDEILEAAMRWHLASERDDMDWDGFSLWLEADPRHRLAYDDVALTERAVDDHAAALADPSEAPLAANDTEAPAVSGRIIRWAPWAGMAVAAMLMAAFFLPQIFAGGPTVYSTGSEPRLIALDDGSTVNLAPNSSLTIDGNAQEQLALEGGAWFDIRHDPSRPMTIEAGGITIRDIGTSFDVQASAGTVRVEVAEGEVVLASAALAEDVRLEAGRRFRFDGAAGRAILSASPDGEFGSWRDGRLSYDAAPLGLVAADLSRYGGVKVELAEGIADRQFSGTFAIGEGDAALRDLAQLMGLELVRDGDVYRLEPASR